MIATDYEEITLKTYPLNGIIINGDTSLINVDQQLVDLKSIYCTVVSLPRPINTFKISASSNSLVLIILITMAGTIYVRWNNLTISTHAAYFYLMYSFSCSLTKVYEPCKPFSEHIHIFSNFQYLNSNTVLYFTTTIITQYSSRFVV